MSESEEANLRDLIDKHVTALGEHFDTVQIFCTKHSEGEFGGTARVSSGSGNVFARICQSMLWVEEQNQIVRTHTDMAIRNKE